MPMRTHTGGCHCGQVRFAVTLDLDQTITCNCSICTKKGSILSAAKANQFRLDSGEDSLAEYQFNKHLIHHMFCDQCGMHPFARGVGKDGSDMVMVNVRCLDNVDLDKLKPQAFEGKSM